MKKKRRKKPGTGRIIFWVVTGIILAALALVTGYRLWSCLINVSPQFHYILISKNGESLKLLNGEHLHLHPKDRIKVLDIETNVCFDQGVRLVAGELDVNALLYEEVPIVELLPERDMFAQYDFSLHVKRYNQDIGHIDVTVEPFLEDWLDKADRTIGGERKVEILKQALRLYPEDREIKERLVREYMALERWKEASSMMEDMIRESPDEKMLYDLLEVYESMSDTGGVISTLRRLLELHPDDIALRYRLASILEKQGKYGEAIAQYEELLTRMKKEDLLPVYKTLGYLYTKTDQIEKAISVYLKAAEMDKDDANIRYNISLLYEKIGRKDKADLFLGEALHLESGDIEGRLKLSESLISEGKLKEAEKYLDEVLKKRPESLKAWLLMASIAEKREDKEALKKIYRSILDIQPQNMTVIYNIGILEYETGSYAAALPYLTKYSESFPKDTDIHPILYDIYKILKDDDHILKEARTLIQLKPKETGYYHDIFEILNRNNRYKDIIEVMEYGVKQNPKASDLREYLVFAYLKTGKDGAAVEQIQEILKTRPEDVSMLMQLARLYEKLGKPKEALATYRRIVEISPDNEEAEEAYLRLRLEVLPEE